MSWHPENQYEGETGVVIASGPSMDEKAYPEAQFALDVVEAAHSAGKCRVLTVNDAFYLAPYADAVYAGDNRWWRHHYQSVTGLAPREVDGLTYKARGELYSKDAGSCEMFKINRLYQDGTTGLSRKPRHVRHGGNSGYQCLNLAFHFGFKRIILLGFDCKNIKENRTHKNHFFGNHPKNWAQASGVNAWRSHFRTLYTPFLEEGVEVINCTLDTSLDAFPLGKIEEYL